MYQLGVVTAQNMFFVIIVQNQPSIANYNALEKSIGLVAQERQRANFISAIFFILHSSSV